MNKMAFALGCIAAVSIALNVWLILGIMDKKKELIYVYAHGIYFKKLLDENHIEVKPLKLEVRRKGRKDV